jgi:hypothetical protein
MKLQTKIGLIAATGLVLGSVNAMASGFGGGWVQEKNTHTLYNSDTASPELHQSVTREQPAQSQMNSFGGGWVQEKNTRTLYYSVTSSPELQGAATREQPAQSQMNSFGGGWIKDRNTNTLSYEPVGDKSTL